MKIIVLNLARDITEDEMLDLFVDYGEVESCVLVLDKVTGKSKGFGFVEMADREAGVAITKLHGRKINGSVLRVKKAQEAAADEENLVEPEESPAEPDEQ